jgi:hypothetical protein
VLVSANEWCVDRLLLLTRVQKTSPIRNLFANKNRWNYGQLGCHRADLILGRTTHLPL